MKSGTVLYFSLCAVTLFLLVSCNNNKKPVSKKPDDIYYTCSMDPQVVEANPGKCPICHMELTAVKKSAQQKNDNELELSPEQIQLGNIQVDTVRNGAMGTRSVLTGTLNFDQTKINAVNARVAGRIEKLYFKNIGDYVPKGARLYALYSEELNNAKQEYLLAVQKRKALGNTVIDFDQVIESAKNKLLLWGMAEEQISNLSRDNNDNVTSFYSTQAGYITSLGVQEGEYVAEGGSIVQLADLSSLWVEAQVYTSQLSQMDQSARVKVKIPDIPGMEMEGKIEFVNPEINPDSRINLVRIKIANWGHQLKPGMSAYVILNTVQQKVLSLPINAVLRDGKMAMIWVQTSQNKFMGRMVETGSEGNGVLQIKSGLKEGDAVVINGAYLLQSEYIFRKGASPMAGMDMGGMKM
ncbi:MAG TPA: efflux RND transporter periplasmic adaptor subunit [Puia sp.]|nr:efflux RND transporter periplasmic adaptor subunit [Puia sp.]